MLANKSEGWITRFVDMEDDLVKVEGLNRLKHLEELDIDFCHSIERLNLPKPNRLKLLTARCCENLVEI